MHGLCYYGAWVLIAVIGTHAPAYFGTYTLKRDCESAWTEITERFGLQPGRHLCVMTDRRDTGQDGGK